MTPNILLGTSYRSIIDVANSYAGNPTPASCFPLLGFAPLKVHGSICSPKPSIHGSIRAEASLALSRCRTVLTGPCSVTVPAAIPSPALLSLDVAAHRWLSHPW